MSVQVYLNKLLEGARSGPLLEKHEIIHGLLSSETPAHLKEGSEALVTFVHTEDSTQGILLCVKIAVQVIKFPFVEGETCWLSSFANAWIMLEQISKKPPVAQTIH
jgi:hypothetical protein